MGLAEVMAGCGDLPDRLLALHTPDTTGHCRACTQYQRPRPKWPCAIRSAAVRAQQIQAVTQATEEPDIQTEPKG